MSVIRSVLGPFAVAMGVGYAARERARRRVVSMVRPDSPASAPEHEPPDPRGAPVEPWHPMLGPVEVAEDSLRENHLALLPWDSDLTGPSGTRLDLPALLILDPVDSVAVFVRDRQVDRHVGRLGAADASRYRDAIAAAAPGGEGVLTTSSQWTRSLPGFARYRVTVDLPDPSGLAPANGLPPGAVVLPLGGALQVTQTEEQAASSLPWLGTAVATSLHSVTQRTGVTERRVIEVRIEGQDVGQLTTARSGALADLVEAAEAGGGVPVCRALVREVSGAVDLTLYVARSAPDPSPA